MKKINVLIALSFVVAIGAGFALGSSSIKPVQATSFDHSNCQYPERWTNTPNGCDNSDPAVPECIKASYSEASEKACIDEFVKQHQTQTPTQTPVTPAPVVTQPTTPKGNTCNG